MSVKGKWRIIAMPDFKADYPDLVEPTYILSERDGAGAFAFGCCTGHIWEASSTEATGIDFSWDGSDEMTEVCGDGSVELQPNGSLHGESATVTATNIPSSPGNGLLQQPAKANSRSRGSAGGTGQDHRLRSISLGSVCRTGLWRQVEGWIRIA